MSEESTEKEVSLSIEAQIESILFVASGPVTLNRLARTLLITKAKLRKALQSLENQYIGRGIQIQWQDESIQLTSSPESSDLIEQFLGLQVPPTRLSQAALEVLAIIAYMQPITRPQIDEIRGVNSDGALRTLLSKGLLEEVGRLEAPGRPILYGTTTEFMQYFGLNKLTDLPPLPEPDLEMVDSIVQEGDQDEDPEEEGQVDGPILQVEQSGTNEDG